MSTQPLISIIIVNYNGGEFLQKAVASLKAQTFQDFELLVVDNASEDGSLDGADFSGLSSVQLLRESKNHGFAKGNNIAAAKARGEWVVLLNPDCIASTTWIEEIVKAVKENADISTFTCAQYCANDHSTLDGTGDAYHIFGIPWRGGFGHPASTLPPKGFCFSACGASAVYRRSLFLDAGGFDERFFCYCEDVDLGYRLQLLGHDCMFLPKAVVYHEGSAITGRASHFTTYHGNRNRTWVFLKNTPLSLLVLTLPGHLLALTALYIKNRRLLDHDGLGTGLRDGLKRGWAMRRQEEFRVQSRAIGLWTLVRRMCWDPIRMSRRANHVRPDKRR